MPKVIIDNDLWGDSIELYNYENTPECEICKKYERGGNFEGLGKRRAKLRTHTDIAIKNKNKNLVGHLGKIKGDPKTIKLRYGKRPKELKSNEIYACACCIESYNMGKNFIKNTPNTLPV